MPEAVPRPCRVPTCPSRVTAARPCPQHPLLPKWQRQGPKGRPRAWTVRRAFVLREQPLCVPCLLAGRERYATEVDHRVPLALGGTDDWENLQPICRPCHADKTRTEGRAR